MKNKRNDRICEPFCHYFLASKESNRMQQRSLESRTTHYFCPFFFFDYCVLVRCGCLVFVLVFGFHVGAIAAAFFYILTSNLYFDYYTFGVHFLYVIPEHFFFPLYFLYLWFNFRANKKTMHKVEKKKNETHSVRQPKI